MLQPLIYIFGCELKPLTAPTHLTQAVRPADKVDQTSLWLGREGINLRFWLS
jgi:hypothetical protein